MVKSLFCLLLVAGLCICIPATDAATLSYTGDLFFTSRNGIPLCVQGQDDMGVPITGEPVVVSTLDVFGINRLAPMSYAQPNGAYECLTANLARGVYELQAFGIEGGVLDGVSSDPVALTRVDTDRRFFTWSGAFSLKEPGQSQTRLATFGLYHEFSGLTTYVPGSGAIEHYGYFSEGPKEQFLLLDPDNPGGPVRIRMMSFRKAYELYSPIYGFEFHFTGYCEFTAGNAAPIRRSCEVVYRDYTGFQIDVFDFTRRSIYQIKGRPVNFSWYWFQ